MAKIKRLRCNLMKLTPQGMMNGKANVFKDENSLSTLSHSSKMSVVRNSLNYVCEKCKILWCLFLSLG